MTDNRRKYPFYDMMSAEQLEKLLEQDSTMMEPYSLSEDEILYITELLAGMEDISSEKAKTSFISEYENHLSDEACLYDLDGSAVQAHKYSDRRKRMYKYLRLIFAASLVLAVMGLVFSGRELATAFEINRWTGEYSWDDHDFTLRMSNDYSFLYRLDGLRAKLAENDINSGWAPGYLPEGFYEDRITSSSGNTVAYVSGRYYNAKIRKSFTIEITDEGSADPCHGFSKDVYETEIYTRGNVDFHIYKSSSGYSVVWTSGSISGSIYFLSSADEIKKMVDSIEAVNIYADNGFYMPPQ